MDRVVLKIKYGDTLRRITLGSPISADRCMTFSAFKQIVRRAFNIPVATGFDIVYIDNENDQVTMGGDDDIKDAFFYQALSPVRAIVVPQGEPQCSAQDTLPPRLKELMIQNYSNLDMQSWVAVCVPVCVCMVFALVY